MLLQKHEKQQDIVQIPHPEIEHLTPCGKEHTTQAGSNGKKFKQTHPLAAQCKKYIVNTEHIPIPDKSLTYTAFKRNLQQFLGLNGKLHRQLVDYLLGITVYNQAYSILCLYTPLLAIEQLVLSNL